MQAQWSDEIATAVVRSKLRGSAASFFQRSNTLQETRVYDDFKKILVDYFKPKLPLAVHQAQFFELKQEKNEKVKAYAVRLQNKAIKVFEGTITDSENGIILA